jgi:hypothetical protein
MVSHITPSIMLVRLERLIENVKQDKNAVAVRLCQKYIKEINDKSITILDIKIVDALFEIELLITLGVNSIALQQLNDIRKDVIKILTNYNIFRNRLMNDTSTPDMIGSLAFLPNDILRNVVHIVQQKYVW